MRFVDDEEELEEKIKSKQTKRLIIMLISFLLLLCMIVISLIIYRIYHPSTITTYIDGVMVKDFDKIVDIEEKDENGKMQMYIPIREFASYLNMVNEEYNYQTFKGDYNPKTEEEDKCYVIINNYEVSLFEKGTKTIYKVNIQDKEKSEEYTEHSIEKATFEHNGNLYTSVEGIEKGYNVSFSYDSNKKVITIYTLDYLANAYATNMEQEQTELKMNLENYSDNKTIFEDLLIVQNSDEQYGIVKVDDYSSFILETQYDKISYLEESSTFLVESNGKVGLFTKDGKRKINLSYDQITSMGKDSNLYAVESDGKYGVIDENEKTIIHIQNDQIGLDNINTFSYNGIKNGYILLKELIPVKQGENWGFYNTKGKFITKGFIYKNIGCSSIDGSSNLYPALEITDCNVIVVQDESGKFSFMDKSGDDTMLPFSFDKVYIRFYNGKRTYGMTFKGKEYQVTKFLNQVQ